MRVFSYLQTLGTGMVVALTAAVLLAAPYGCSKEDKKAPAQSAEQAAQSEEDTARAHFDKGVEFSLKGELDSAVKEYEAAIKINPDIAEAHNNIGFAYMDNGDLEKAVEHQKKALELKPDLANGYFGLAMAYEKMGRNEEAIANWKEFTKLAQPHSKWWMTAQEHIRKLEGKAPAGMEK